MERASAARIPTMWGPFTAYCYRSILDGIEHIAMVKVKAIFKYNLYLTTLHVVIEHITLVTLTKD